MKYDTRKEVERIGQAGSKQEVDKRGTRYRYLSSFWLYVEEDDRAFTPHARSGFWEAWVTRWLSEELEHCSYFIDVGANVGYYTMLAGVARVKTYAIEPNPDLTNYLFNSGEKNKCLDVVSVIPVALSDTFGHMTMVIPPNHSGGGSLIGNNLDEPRVLEFKSHNVEHRPLDRLLNFGWTSKNILIKIDAEGAEPKIWDGMQETWDKHDVVVTLEWHGRRWADKEAFADKLFKHRVSWIDHEGFEQRIDKEWLLANDELIMIVVRK